MGCGSSDSVYQAAPEKSDETQLAVLRETQVDVSDGKTIAEVVGKGLAMIPVVGGLLSSTVTVLAHVGELAVIAKEKPKWIAVLSSKIGATRTSYELAGGVLDKFKDNTENANATQVQQLKKTETGLSEMNVVLTGVEMTLKDLIGDYTAPELAHVPLNERLKMHFNTLLSKVPLNGPGVVKEINALIVRLERLPASLALDMAIMGLDTALDNKQDILGNKQDILGNKQDILGNKQEIAEMKDASSVEAQLRVMLKSQADTALDKDIVLHVPAFGHDKRKFDGDEKSLYNVLEKTRAFLADGVKDSLLVLGESGAGKSTFLKHACQVLSKESLADPEAPIPIWIDLPKLRDMKKGAREVLGEFLSVDNVNKLQDAKDKSIVFLFDSYDEVDGRNNLFQLNELSKWQGRVQMITTCRTQYKQAVDDSYFSTTNTSGLRIIYMSALTDANREAYTTKYAELNTNHEHAWTAQQYLNEMHKLDGAEPFADTILRLKVVLDVLPVLVKEHAKDPSDRQDNFLLRKPVFSDTIQKRSVVAVQVYGQYVNSHFERQLVEKRSNVSLEVFELQEFCETFSIRLHNHGVTSVTFDSKNPKHVKGKWNDLLGIKNDSTNAKRAAALLKAHRGGNNKGAVYEFEHKSFQDYFLSCAVVRLLRDTVYEAHALFDEELDAVVGLDYRSLSPFLESKADSALFHENFSDDTITTLAKSPLNSYMQSEILKFVAEHAQSAVHWMLDALFLVVYASRSTDKLNWAASNALTILNLLHLGRLISFSGMDFSKIRAPHAHLQSAMLSQTNFAGADLSHVSFRDACLDRANLTQCDLTSMQLHIKPTLLGHSNTVNSVSYSPDGKQIISGSFDKTIRVWDAVTGEQLHKLEGHSSFVTSVSYSPDGKQIISGSRDKTTRIWNAVTGEQLHKLEGHSGGVSSVSYSPDGKQIISGSHDATIRIWNAVTGEQLHKLEGHSGVVYSVSYSPDGKQIISGSFDKTIRIWNAVTGEQLHKLEGHSGGVSSVSYSPDGKQIISGSDDATIRIWNAVTGEQLHKLEGHSGVVYSVSYSPEGKQIISGSFDKTIRVWDAVTGEQLHKLEGHSSFVTSVSYSPDGKQIISGSFDKTIRIWDAVTGEQLHKLEGHSDFVASVSYSPDGKQIISGSADKTIRIWNAVTGEQLHKLEGHSGPVSSVSYSPDGKQIISGSLDTTIRVWDAVTGEQLHKLEGHSDWVNSVSYSPDGKQIVSGSNDETVCVWDTETGEQLHTLEGHSDTVNSVSYSPDGKQIISGSGDKTIRVWDAVTGKQLHKLEGHSHYVNSVSYSPDGKQIISGSHDKTIRVWDAVTGEQLHKLEGHSDHVYSVSYSPDGTQIISGSADKTIRIWNAVTGEQLHKLEGHSGEVFSVSYSPDGKQIISGSDDKMIRVWGMGKEPSSYNRPSFCCIWWSSSPGLSALHVKYDGAQISDMNRRVFEQLQERLM